MEREATWIARLDAWIRWIHWGWWLAASAAAFLAVMMIYSVLVGYDQELKSGQRNAGIVTLELAFNTDWAGDILEDWRNNSSHLCPPSQNERAESPLTNCAEKSLLVDFGFIPAYSIFGAAFFLFLLNALGVRLDAFWLSLAAAPFAAGLADVGENALLLHALHLDWQMDGYSQALSAPVLAAGVLAVIKFFLIGLALTGAAALTGFWLFSKTWQKTAEAEPDDGDKERPGRLLKLKEMLEREEQYIDSRRKKAGLSDEKGRTSIGLALSGGGIRSATLCLGVVQALAKNTELTKRIDYLSTVSGGGYLGSALSSLLSCRQLQAYPGLSDRSQYRFGDDDSPHFRLEQENGSPFHELRDPPNAGSLSWLNGSMVLAHLRAFGDYLVRKHRLLDRDVLRALGTVLTGIFSTLVFFFHVILIGAALGMFLIALSGGDPIPRGYTGAAAYLGGLVDSASRPGLAWAFVLGGLFAAGTGLVVGVCSVKAPSTWFRRGGESDEDSRQRRALWVFGILAAVLGFATPGVVSSFLPEEVRNALLLPPLFFAGGLLSSALAYVALVALVPGNPELRSNRGSRSYVGSNIGLFLYFLLAATGLVAITLVFGEIWLLSLNEQTDLGDALAGGGGAAVLSALLSGLLAWQRGRKEEGTKSIKKMVSGVGRLSELAQKLVLGLAVAVLLVAALIICVALVEQILIWLGISDPGASEYLGFAATAGVLLLVFGFTVDFNKLSLHYFYRDRLVECYMRTLAPKVSNVGQGSPELRRDHSEVRLVDLHGRLVPGAPEKKPKGAQPEQAFKHYVLRSSFRDRVQIWKDRDSHSVDFAGAATAAPYHLYNACLNLGTERDAAYRTRKSDIFLFSKLHCGSRATGYVDTNVYRSGVTKAARAMTISGAAANSAVGRQSFFAQSFAATLFNIRLGQWLENPSYRSGKHAWRQETGVFWPKYLLMEILGMSDSRRRLIHLSDGGHTGDNLGLISLLQRQCDLILAVDAECDTDFGFGSLMNAIQYAEVDLGVKIDIRLGDLSPDENGMVLKHYAVGSIDYGAGKTGHLVVLKSSIHKDDAEPVLKYRQSHPRFPQETTADQFFSEEQFEAYRKLGQNIAEQLLRDHPELGMETIKVIKRSQRRSSKAKS